MSSDVVVIGGGVIGLSIAYALLQEGVGVTLVERSRAGRSASWAGAGMIAPESSRGLDQPEPALRTLSAATHERWAAELRETTGIPTGYQRCGGIDLALEPAELQELHATFNGWIAQGIDAHWLDLDQLGDFEPGLHPAPLGACFVPGRAQIRNPRHLRALESACQRLGVDYRPFTSVVGFGLASNHRLQAVFTSDGAIACGHAVLAAGAWSGALLTSAGHPNMPTPPVKGQIVLLNGPPGYLRHIIEWGMYYLVPRDDGRILVGATEEQAGFDDRPTAAGGLALLNAALHMAPGLSGCEVERTWAGLRPGSRDNRPYIGRLPGLPNLLLATGHCRAGLQLSTGTALVIADLIQGRAPRIPLADLDTSAGPASAAPFRS